MTLPGIFHSQSTAAERKVLYLAYSDTSVQAHLLAIVGTKAEILERSAQLQFSDNDAALVRTDECLQQLGSESESVNEVLLGLDPSWVHNGEIAQTKKALLKRIFTDLSLNPLGFISFAEALSQDLSTQESTKSALLTYFTEEKIVLIHLNNGVIERAESVGRSDTITNDLSEGLARFARDTEDASHLPAKILLASFALQEEQLQDLQQQLLEHSWTESKFFLQAPVVSVISHEATVAAIAKEASAALALDTTDTTFQANKDRFNSDATATHAVEGAASTLVTAAKSSKAAVGLASGAALSPASGDEELAIDPTMKSFGIPMNQQVAQEEAKKHSEPSATFGTLISEDASDPVHATPEVPEEKKHDVVKKNVRRSIAVGIGAGVLVLIALAFGAVMFFTSATAIITLDQKPVSEEVDITLDPSVTSSDTEERVLAAAVITEELTGSGVAQTTGVKIVGEQAQGEVMIYNKTEAEKTFESGTVLTAGDVTYLLEETVTVPAALVEKTSGGEKKEYGQKATTARADKIGDEGNSGEELELKVASFAESTYSAESIKGFTGGSSREVRVVSEKDRADLLKEVTRKVLDQANLDFKTRSGNGTYILPTTDISVTEATYDAELENEANTLSLDITAKISALSYAVEDLKPIAEATLRGKVPEGYTLSTQDPQILSAPVEQATAIDKPVLLKANISSYAIPMTNLELWESAIAGKTIAEAQEYLVGLDEVSQATVTVQPTVAAQLFPRLPQSLERITLEVAASGE